jgi:hypothetical protein
VAGHPLTPVWHEWSAQESPQVLSQRACTAWTQDNNVALAIPNNPTQDSDLLRTCLGKAGVLSVVPMSYNRMRERSFQESPLWFEPETLSLEAWARVYVKGLVAQGFVAGKTIGVVHDDAPSFTSVVQSVLIPELRRAGATKVVTGAATVRGAGDLASGNAQMSNIVLRFRSEGVSNVMFFEPWVGWVLFAQNANSQSWKPSYGFSSQSIVWVAIQTGLVPTQQLVGAKAVSWNPGVDIPPEGRGQWPRMALCLDIYEKAGFMAELRSSNNALHKALTWCEGLLTFVDAGRGVSGAVTPASLAAALTSLGDLPLANAPRARFTADRHYGAVEWRPAAYDAGCTCLRYTGGPSPI